MTMAEPIELTPKHIKAARALLAWSQQDLAKNASVATSTVADFERGHRTPVANNSQAIRSALETAGIRFLLTGAVIGPPVPALPSTRQTSTPPQWIEAADLATWTDRFDGVLGMPNLLAKLIRATHGSEIRLRFPSDEGIRHPGWDGQTNTTHESTYVPQGIAGWEIGSQRSKVEDKANKDYKKRTSDPDILDPATSTYIYVTPRHWPGKDAWAKARQAEGQWREVRAYDADDLVHWIELAPAVGLWLAALLNKWPPGVQQLEDVWEEWSLATQWPLSEELVLSDRDEDSAHILRWLRSGPSVLSIKATTTEEAIAFFHATINLLPDEAMAHYRARCIVATDADAARRLAAAPAPLIIVIAEPEPGLARSLAERGHFVLQAYDDRQVSQGAIRTLAKPSRDGIARALGNMGIAEGRARSLARDSARNLGILRRLIPAAPGHLPDWAQEPPPHALLAALLAGGWNEDTEGDKTKVSELAGEPYERVVATLARYVGQFDSPLRKIGSNWRIASPQDAWMLLAQYLTPDDIARFQAVAHAVLGSTDPRYDMNPNDRWMAAVRGVHPVYSGLLRHGIGEVLIMLALWGDRIKLVPHAHRQADEIVKTLLHNADRRKWWSLSGNFRLLAEASPKAFLDAIEESLDQNDPPIAELFGKAGDGVFETEYLSDLLWALESLAWSPDLLPRVTLVLARLDAIDPGGSHMNRPGNSLRDIYLLWAPQTHASLDQRLRALDLIRKQENNAAWKLMLSALPHSHSIMTPSAEPRWRDYTTDDAEPVTEELISHGSMEFSKRLLEDAPINQVRWLDLLGNLTNIVSSGREATLQALQDAEPHIKDKAARRSLWEKLRKLLHQHRQFPDAEWVLPRSELDQLENIYNRFAPSDLLESIAWLFQESVELPDPSHKGWKAGQRQSEEARVNAIRQVFASRGIDGILDLARLVPASGYVGIALSKLDLKETEVDALLERTLRSDNDKERGIAHGLIFSLFRKLKATWAIALIARARNGNWGKRALLSILNGLPQERWVWEQAAQAGDEIDSDYWQSTPSIWITGSQADVAYAIQKLISAGRARHALRLASHGPEGPLPSDLLVGLLEAVVDESNSATGNNEPSMFRHDVEKIFEQLDERPEVNVETLALLEWKYLSLLERSARSVKVLSKNLSEQPSLFVKMLEGAYRPSEEYETVDPEPANSKFASNFAKQAYRLLQQWSRIPGTREDGTIEVGPLEDWIKKARSQAKDIGRSDIADSKIGAMLSASPLGKDGNWPAEAVRHVLDLFRSKPMIEGFEVGKHNRRGMTVRNPSDGGNLERKEAEKFRKWGKAIAFDYPYTAKALEELADDYEREAKRHDEDAERRDLLP